MSAISGMTGNSANMRVDYLNLLVTQLKNQNPLEPMSNADMTAQLAQISQLEHLESINSQISQLGRLENIDNMFQRAMLTAELNEATALIGKTVSFFPGGSGYAVAGRVDSVNIVDGAVLLNVGGYGVGLDEIKSISE